MAATLQTSEFIHDGVKTMHVERQEFKSARNTVSRTLSRTSFGECFEIHRYKSARVHTVCCKPEVRGVFP